MTQIAVTSGAVLPAPLSSELETRFSLCRNRLDPEGLGFSIAAEDAPSEDLRQALQARFQRLTDYLAPIGQKGAAGEVMGLSLVLKMRRRSVPETDKTFDLYVENLADLAAFAVVTGCRDYRQGTVGDCEWMPEAPALRAHVVSKLRDALAEKQRIETLLKARIRAPRTSAERRAAVVAMARQATQEMRKTASATEAARSGGREAATTPPPPMSEMTVAQAEAKLAELKTTSDRPLTLSPVVRRSTMLAQGRDPNAYDEVQRLESEFEDQRRTSV